MSNIAEVIRYFPPDLQDSMLRFWESIKDEIGVKREDFTELKNIVHDLADTQQRTEKRIEELAVAQNRTEERVEELVVAQNRTEERMKELAAAQNRTEERMEELAAAHKDTERSLKRLSDTIEFKIGGLGSRWGIGSELSFRSGLTEILVETGYSVINYVEHDTEGFVFGKPAVIEIDIIIKGQRTICVEIKSSTSRSDVYVFMKKTAFYEKTTGKTVDRMLIITPFIDDKARSVAEENNIVICDSISELGETARDV